MQKLGKTVLMEIGKSKNVPVITGSFESILANKPTKEIIDIIYSIIIGLLLQLCRPPTFPIKTLPTNGTSICPPVLS